MTNTEQTKRPKHAKFYVLLEKMGIPIEDKRDFIIDYTDGITDSLTELWTKYPGFYSEMIRHMEGMVKQIHSNTYNGEMDKLRKRVIAAIGGYFKQIGQVNNIDYIKATACQATGYKTFNKIPKERLRNVYNAFTKLQKDFASVGRINHEHLYKASMLN